MRKYCSRVVIENFFEPCMLFLLITAPSYGYELKNNLHQRCGCNVNLGNLYKCLGRLEKSGCVKKKKTAGVGGPDRVVYSITSKGEKLLKTWIDELEQEVAIINKLITNYKKHYANSK